MPRKTNVAPGRIVRIRKEITWSFCYTPLTRSSTTRGERSWLTNKGLFAGVIASTVSTLPEERSPKIIRRSIESSFRSTNEEGGCL